VTNSETEQREGKVYIGETTGLLAGQGSTSTMPHPTTPSKDKEATCSSQGLKLQAKMPEYKAAERPLAARTRTSSSGSPRPQFCPIQVDIRSSGDSVLTPPPTPTQLSSLRIPPTYQASPEVLSPPATPAGHRRYSSAGSIFDRRRSTGAASWKGFPEGPADKLSSDRYKGSGSLSDAQDEVNCYSALSHKVTVKAL
jgi:hypothetical protein